MGKLEPQKKKIHELNLLVVEDDDFQRRMIIKMLHALGITSICDVGNGKQALEMLRAENAKPVDIALCDLDMPEMDGMEFLRFLAQEHHDVSIVIISALERKLLSSVGRMTRMYGIQLLGTIEKPIVLGQLKALLLKYERMEQRWHSPVASANFTLEEILNGIKGNQFEPYFQPKVNLQTGRIVGAEALARWLHPEQGMIAPYAFIPLLEKSGNIDDLTFIMLRKSALACRTFHAKNFGLTVSVNLSLISLSDTTLADKITKVVHDTGLDPRYITLEITESAAMTEVAPALENLARLCMHGFTLSIDDFGTGYSTIQQLTRIAFGELKIDQSFVRDFAEYETLRIVVKSSIDMARSLGVASVAEGVETQQDWDTLKLVGCDTAQGYFIAKPMDLQAFIEFCTKHAR